MPTAGVLLACVSDSTTNLSTPSSTSSCMMCSHVPDRPQPQRQDNSSNVPTDSQSQSDSCGEYSFEMQTSSMDFPKLVLSPRGQRMIIDLHLQSRDLSIASPPPEA
ncbi:MAG: hypothetical protein ACF8OB_12425 [Phycisphaeraceae bacterium JB051]